PPSSGRRSRARRRPPAAAAATGRLQHGMWRRRSIPNSLRRRHSTDRRRVGYLVATARAESRLFCRRLGVRERNLPHDVGDPGVLGIEKAVRATGVEIVLLELGAFEFLL